MERFYGKDHSVGVSNDEAEALLRTWRSRAAERDEQAGSALVEWLDERLEQRTVGFRAFRISPPPEPIEDAGTLELFAQIVAESASELSQPETESFAGRLSADDRRVWLAKMLDILAFVNEARGEHPDVGAPPVATADALEVNLRRRWARFIEQSRRENFVFPDDPRYPDPQRLLHYLDDILEMAVHDGREERREWPFPKILWEREILLEKMGRCDELAQTMRRSAALEDDVFKRQTEAYIATFSASA